jgi:CHAT domain-containing protein
VVSSYFSCTPTPFPPASRALTWRDVNLALVGESRDAQSKVFMPGIELEVKGIEKIALANKVKITYQSTHSTTVAEVAEAMKEANICHFACHADQSSLYLGDGMLSIQHLVQVRPKEAFLAFLSACETSGQRGQSLVDGMLAYGFQHVIATMW